MAKRPAYTGMIPVDNRSNSQLYSYNYYLDQSNSVVDWRDFSVPTPIELEFVALTNSYSGTTLMKVRDPTGTAYYMISESIHSFIKVANAGRATVTVMGNRHSGNKYTLKIV